MPTAAEILKMSAEQATILFPGDEREIKKRFHRLAMTWHPDRSSDPKSGDVLQKLIELKEVALRGCLKVVRHEVLLKTDEDKTFRLNFLKENLTEAGRILIGTNTVTFIHRPDLGDIGRAEKERVENLKFANDMMRKQMRTLLPCTIKSSALKDGGHFTVMERPAGSVFLKDLIEYHGGQMPVRHVAWIVSGLMNIACYLEWAGLVHGAISPEALTIQPEKHSVHLLGGWGFVTKIGERPIALPGRTTEVYPKIAVKGQAATPEIDASLIRNVALDCLGKSHGGQLLTEGTVPKPFANWISLPPASRAVADYEAWMTALVESFGPRRFEKMSCTSAKIYGV
ncbi:J domain-containing protein [Roseibium sp. RKSG952]|uniref:J domain-containing protein n=1 Tax=Roseibium sp. RKSG952 TaxID=2529384 RepID=UPI0012BC9AAE|nr:J domain-containing protein [Roseibium sp. RKSG952]MTH95069.1 J domain-containing protein [Roseibium sp. RKSG952]